MNEAEMKTWIDNASYEELLTKWRFESDDCSWFRGDMGIYFERVLKEKREEVGSEEHVRISKSIGW